MVAGVAGGDPREAQAATPGPAAEGTATSGAVAPSSANGSEAASVSGQPSIPAAIALAEISTRAEETSEHLRSIVTRLESSANLEEAEATVAVDGKRLQMAADRTNAMLQFEPRLSVLNDLVHAWTEGHQRLSALSAQITAHTSDCLAALDEIQKLSDLWTRTGEAARAQGAPEELIGRVDATLGDLQRTHKRILALRDRLLAFQAESTRQLGVCDQLLARLDQSRHEEAEELGLRTGGPIWRAPSEGYGRDALFRPILAAARSELTITASFLSRHSSFLPLQLVLFAFLATVMRRARSRAEQWTDCGPEIHAHLAVLELPYSVAFLLTGMCAYTLQPDAPRLLFDAMGTLVAVPILRILQRIVHPLLMRPIYGMVALWVVDRVQDFIAGSPLLEQIVLCLTAGGGLVFMLWSVSPGASAAFSSRSVRPVGLAE